jgi:hypothetical protein
MLAKTLKWPVISLLIVGGTHFAAEAIQPGLRDIFVPAVVAPLLLVFGIWVGYKMVQFGGNYGHVILAGALLGILPVVLDIVGFGMILGRGLEYGMLAGTLGFGMILFGSLVGGGFALSK